MAPFPAGSAQQVWLGRGSGATWRSAIKAGEAEKKNGEGRPLGGKNRTAARCLARPRIHVGVVPKVI